MPDIKEQDEEISENVPKEDIEEKNPKKKNSKKITSPSKKIRSKTNSGPQRKSATHHNKIKSSSITNR